MADTIGVMPDSSPFRFGVSDLLSHSGVERRERVEAVVDWAIELGRTSGDAPLVADLLLYAIPGGLMVQGEVRATVQLRCYRCTTPTRQTLTVPFRQLVALAGADADADYLLEGDVVDTEPIIRDEVLLALPELPTCRDDCLGLCPTCGADLNTGACSGHDDESNSPFAELRDLLETKD